MIRRVSVIGLGKLGACMAACFADKGIQTIGVDCRSETVRAVNAGCAPVDEPLLAETMARAKSSLTATMDCHMAVQETEATFIVVPTPSEAHGGFSLRYVREAAQEIGEALRVKSDYHVVVLTSTVLPGSTEYGVLPILEQASGKRCGKDFGLCYNPEFIALGSVIRDFLHPDFVLIGESDPQGGDRLASVYARICENHPPVARMNFVNAELTKLAVNTFMTMKITFANFLAALCEQLSGGDISTVTSALALFGGVGSRSLQGGIGYGGPCLPRDNVALAYLAQRLGQSSQLPQAVDQYNRSIPERLWRHVEPHVRPGDRVAILGLAYKPGTVVVEASQGAILAKELAARGLRVTVYDPKAMEAARALLGNEVTYAASVSAAIDEVKVILVTTPDPSFHILPSLLPHGKRTVVIDVWRVLRERLEQDKRVTYVPIGIGMDRVETKQLLEALWVEPPHASPVVDQSLCR